ncbi:MAG TPA: CopD family protein [Candidatus Methylacidiphilales bacterium]|nr:CopD family protein [Candidatus Methylacidiphilales bacterium]
MTMTVLFVLARSGHFAAALLLFALPFFVAWIMRPTLIRAAPETPRIYEAYGRVLMKWFWAALLIEALSGAAWFWLVTLQMSGDPLWSLPASDDLQTVLWQTQFGQLWLGRAVALVVLCILTALASRGSFFFLGKGPLLGGLALAVSGTLLASLAWAGHAAAGINSRTTHLLADTLHLALGAVWPVGLAPFALFLRYAGRAGQAWPVMAVLAAVRRFSETSFVVVLVLVATGFVNGWFLVGSWAALFSTLYGWWLLAKIAVTAMMIGLGAWNRWSKLPALLAAPEDSTRYLSLRRNVIAETMLAGIVLLIVGIMGMTAPPQ